MGTVATLLSLADSSRGALRSRSANVYVENLRSIQPILRGARSHLRVATVEYEVASSCSRLPSPSPPLLPPSPTLSSQNMAADQSAPQNAEASSSKHSIYEGSTQYRHWRFSQEELARNRTSLNAAAVSLVRDAFERDEVCGCSLLWLSMLLTRPSLARLPKYRF